MEDEHGLGAVVLKKGEAESSMNGTGEEEDPTEERGR